MKNQLFSSNFIKNISLKTAGSDHLILLPFMSISFFLLATKKQFGNKNLALLPPIPKSGKVIP
jgi:hypothetical protein